MEYLRGNYKVTKPIEDEPPTAEDAVKTFEDFARERLGGSIAFVMKDNTFLWAGKPSSTEKPPKKS